MLKNKICLGVAIATLGFGTLVATAESSVIGQLNSSDGVILNAGSNQQNISEQHMPYIQGDVVSTKTGIAKIVFTSGSMTISANSVAAVINEAPAEVVLESGGINVKLVDAMSMTFDTPAGKFVVASDTAIDASAVFAEGEFAMISNAGDISVESGNGDVVTNIGANKAFTYVSETGARAVDVQLLGGLSTLGMVGIGIAVVAAVVVIADDDEPTSP